MSQNLKEKLIKIIEQSLVINSEAKNELIETLQNNEIANLDELEKVLMEGVEYQNKLMGKILNYDKDFVSKVKHFKKDQFFGFQHQIEQKERTEENPDELIKSLNK